MKRKEIKKNTCKYMYIIYVYRILAQDGVYRIGIRNGNEYSFSLFRRYILLLCVCTHSNNIPR